MAHDSGYVCVVSKTGGTAIVPSAASFRLHACGDPACEATHVIALNQGGDPICEITFSDDQLVKLRKKFV